MKIPVVAGNYSQFRNFLFTVKDDPDYWYVDSPDQLRGLHGVHVMTIGTYYERSDWDEMEQEIQRAEYR